MSSLAGNKCEACRIDAPLLSMNEIKRYLSELEGWIIEESSINKLSKTYNFNNYNSAVKFANAVANIADKEDHHPQIILEWGKVSIIWWSHKIKGLHKNDFICAAKTDLAFNS